MILVKYILQWQNMIIRMNLYIYADIHEILDFPTQLSLICTNTAFRENLPITNLHNIPDKYLDKMDKDKVKYFIRAKKLIIENSDILVDISQCMKNLRKLHIYEANECNVYYDLSGLTNLKVLYACGNCGIRDDSIKNLDLIKVVVSSNRAITNITHLKNLKKLIAEYNSGLTNQGIFGLDLIELSLNYNSNINHVQHFTNLKELSIIGVNKVEQQNIKNLDLLELNIDGNDNITDISHMTNLFALTIGWHQYVDISMLKNLKKLYLASNRYTDKDLTGINLYKLHLSFAENITSLTYMTSLKVLIIDKDSKITSQGLYGLQLEKLTLEDNQTIIDVSFLTSLKKLCIRGISSIDETSINKLNLKKIYTREREYLPVKIKYVPHGNLLP